MESPSMLTPTAHVVNTKSSLPFVHRHFILLKMHYFLFFSAFGMIYPILNVTLSSRGLSTTELSYINIIIPFLIFFANPLVGYIADHTRRYLISFNIILALCTAVFAAMFSLPIIKSHNIVGSMIHSTDDYVLNFCASQDTAMTCAARSACGCSYLANCTLIDTTDFQQRSSVRTIGFSFSIGEKNVLQEQKNAHDMNKLDKCGTQFNVSVSQALQNIGAIQYQNLRKTATDSGEIASCRITCSTSHFCNGARFDNQTNYVVLYSLLFVLGAILISNAIPVGASIGFASLDRPERFGIQRLFGTIGFGISALAASLVYGYFKTDLVYVIMFSITTLICGFVTSFIRIGPSGKRSSRLSDEKAIAEKDDLLKNNESKSKATLSELLYLLKKLDVIVFLSLAFIWGMSYAALDPYLYLYINEIAPCSSYDIIGWMSLASAIAEVTAFCLAELILKYLGTNISSVLVFVAFSVRFAGYYFIRRAEFLVFMESMHFFNFGIMYFILVRNANSIATEKLSGTLQGLALGFSFGLGRGTGLIVSSFIYKYRKQPFLFLVFSIGNLVALVIYIVYLNLHKICLKRSNQRNNNEQLDIPMKSEAPLNNELPYIESDEDK